MKPNNQKPQYDKSELELAVKDTRAQLVDAQRQGDSARAARLQEYLTPREEVLKALNGKSGDKK